MRILNVDASIDVLDGGQSERTLQMSRWLATTGEDVDVLVLDKGLSAQRLEAIRPARVVPLRTLNRRFYVPGERRRVREEVATVDVIHLMGYWSVLNALVFDAARRAQKPYVLCPAGSWRVRGRSRILKFGYDRIIGRRIVDGAARVVAITHQEREQFESFGVAPSRIVVMPNAVDAADFAKRDDAAFRSQFGLGPAPFILFLGRLAPVKGPDLLLEAFAASNDAAGHHLVYAGPDAGMAAGLRSRVGKLGLEDRVHFIGPIAGNEKSMALHAADFLAIPSRHEAMSIVVLEAGICGTPVLLTDQCGLPEVGATEGGIIVPPDAGAIAAGIDRMIGADRVMMGARMRDLVVERFTWQALVQQYRTMYAEILAQS